MDLRRRYLLSYAYYPSTLQYQLYFQTYIYSLYPKFIITRIFFLRTKYFVHRTYGDEVQMQMMNACMKIKILETVKYTS